MTSPISQNIPTSVDKIITRNTSSIYSPIVSNGSNEFDMYNGPINMDKNFSLIV